MKKEILRSAAITQGRTEMSEGEFRNFLNALGYKSRKGELLEIRLDSEAYDEDDDKRVYHVNWRVKAE